MKKLFTDLTLCVMFASLISCAKSQTNEVTYTIKKGSHYSNAPHRIVHSKLNYTITFDASAMYSIDSVEQADINKLFGFNSCSALHDYQSARLGWRWYHDSLQIMYYIYDQGERVYGYLTSVPMNVPSEYELVQTDSEYRFKVNGVKFIYKKKWKCKALYNYHLWPYFGGNIKAPHDITIKFRRTNEK